jgi:class 3 adenylate cyclase
LTETAESALSPPPETNSEVHTFLLANVRGYTRFTQDRGDEAAASLVAKFIALMTFPD